MSNRLFSNIIFAHIAAALAFVVVPVFMISQAPHAFFFLDFPTFIYSGLIFALVAGSLLSLAIAFLHGLRLQKVASSISLFALVWVVTAGFVLPVSVSTGGMVDAEFISSNRLNFGIVAIISFGLSTLASTIFRRSIIIFLTFVILAIVGSMFFSVSSIYDYLSKPNEDNAHRALSSNRNILVISFDGLPGELVSNVIRNNSRFLNTFKDFKIFENVVSQSPATTASLMGEIYGVQDYKSMGNDQVHVLQTLANNLNKHLLTSVVSDSYQFGDYPPNIAKAMALHPLIDNYQEKSETFNFFRYPIVRLATSKALRLSNWSRNVEPLKTYIIGAPQSKSLASKLKYHVGPKWDVHQIQDILKYDNWVNHLGVSNKEFSIRYLHFTFTHFPVDFDAACEYKSDDAIWYKNHQNEAGIRLEIFCALEKWSYLLMKLKSLGIYDKSLIVFKSDHGKPANYFSKYPDNLRINGQGPAGGVAGWNFGYNRYKPTLMIKEFGASSGEITYYKNLVLLNDLPKTLCANSTLKIRCDYFHGVDLLGKEFARDEPYYIYVPKNLDSTYHFDTHISVRIPSRNMELINAMEMSSAISLSEK